MLVNENILDKTVKALNDNNMKTLVVKTGKEALSYISALVSKTTTTGHSGSMTLENTNIVSYLKENTDYKSDRSVHHSVDYYFTSANAITEDGKIYEVDGFSNRISCIANGPSKVVIIASANKIVKDENDAKKRVMTTAAPLNAKRLSKKTPCATSGECIALKMGARCKSPERICSNTMIMEQQTVSGRVTIVLITDETFGY